jgi:hypothetical protein
MFHGEHFVPAEVYVQTAYVLEETGVPALVIRAQNGGKAMKIVLVVMLLTVFGCAQDQSSLATAACGASGVTFDVSRDESRHTVTPPDSGKARVYFVRDLGIMNCLGSCGTTKMGLDGEWVGASQRNSYFSVLVDPGEHHVCSTDGGKLFAFAHFAAEAGKVYYFRTRRLSGKYQEVYDLEAIDGDQGKYLISSYPLAVSHVKP